MKSEKDRDSVCDLYEEYFHTVLVKFDYFDKALFNLKDIFKKYGKLELFCWCAPKRCHGETIKKYILDSIKEEEE
jgi:hypothetical protein